MAKNKTPGVVWNPSRPGGKQMAAGPAINVAPKVYTTQPVSKRAVKMERKAAKGLLPNLDK